jgi:hypothetical protein
VEKKEPSYTSGGNVNTTTMENSMKAPHNTKNRTAIWFINTTPRDTPEGM